MQKTVYEMRISDWSSDVCSSDLIGTRAIEDTLRIFERCFGVDARHVGTLFLDRRGTAGTNPGAGCTERVICDTRLKIGRAAGRGRVCQDVEISVGAVSLKKKDDIRKLLIRSGQTKDIRPN